MLVNSKGLRGTYADCGTTFSFLDPSCWSGGIFTGSSSHGASTSSVPNLQTLNASGNTPEEIACLQDPNCDMTANLLQLLREDLTGTGAGALPCGSDPSNPCGATSSSGIPSWIYWTIAGLGAVILLRR